MSVFERLRSVFPVTWTTALVGWEGLGVLSPWPGRWTEFPPLLRISDLVSYASERLIASSSAKEEKLIVDLLEMEQAGQTREAIRGVIGVLSAIDGGECARELRKWRVIMLQDVISRLPPDPTQALLALTEFWQNFGFPIDGPHEVQGRGNNTAPEDYYRASTLQRMIEHHQAWMAHEITELKAAA